MNDIVPSSNNALANPLPSLSPADRARVVQEARDVTEALSYPTFASIKDAARGTLRSANSVRVYEDTWARWVVFAADNGLPPESLHAEMVKVFVKTAVKTTGKPLSRSSKNRMLAAMRTLMSAARDATANNPAVVQQYGAIADWRLPHDHDTPPVERVRAEPKALKRAEILKVFDAVCEDRNGKPLSCARNQAIVRTLFYTGMRRAELAAMEWEHIDFENNTIRIPHGKGDKERWVPMLGDCRLSEWKAVLESESGSRQYVFPSISKGDKLGPDKPISGNAIYNLCIKYDYRPHDARRTVGTTVAKNADVKDAQTVLGHANASTTLDHYVMGNEAEELARTIELDY